MREIGVLEAKTHFSGLIEQVAREGEGVVVTRHGRPLVRIVPMDQPMRDPHRDFLAEAKAIWAQTQARGGAQAPIDVDALVREDREAR